ncbi:low specificity L-threonine aldolase [Corynebacterium sp.]|uniref:threonine aldolase family protein n=1 Tax=Corynebacterium sp. TaxID=1720 RepID=UPI0026DCDC0B|nr:aminotransferase class I/II-fold pyridoxal phosphate-dependent enzyme [Corynebacterium sp.]MDO5031239.1 beta-eliminating lyase-related protein [Corynebacterium sp.]
MIHFGNDYHRSAHPRVLEAIARAEGPFDGYGLDPLCAKAAAAIRGACQAPEAGVHFLVGGTQTNATVIASQLRPWEGVISADGGHIATHETGAIEHAGHKVLTLPADLGKISAEQVDSCVREYHDSGVEEHMPEPAMVYVSQPTEYGTVYSRAELRALREVCDEHGLSLFVDGARLGYALSASDVTLPELATLAHVFSIGGTKCGALFGEAVVFPRTSTSARVSDARFRNAMKQNGALLAKGWLLGAQFTALFTDDLYATICAQANAQARRIAQAFATAGIDMLFDSPTNQQFALLTREQEEALSEQFVCQFFEEHQGLRAVRFCTSWATDEEDVDALCAAISALK